MSGRQQRAAQARREHAEHVEEQAERVGMMVEVSITAYVEHVILADKDHRIDPLTAHDIAENMGKAGAQAAKTLYKGARLAAEQVVPMAQRAGQAVAGRISSAADANRWMYISKEEMSARFYAELASQVDRINHDHAHQHVHAREAVPAQAQPLYREERSERGR
jgi:hypothetical protein